jgi:hypothetical protein
MDKIYDIHIKKYVQYLVGREQVADGLGLSVGNMPILYSSVKFI